MSKYLPGGDEHCPTNSRYLQMCLVTDERTVDLPRSLLRALVEIAQCETDGVTKRTLEPHRQMILDYVSEQMGDQQAALDLAYLVHYLKYDGQLRNALHPDVRREALTMCDGFGRTEDDDLLYDWSHVRDSTPEALAAARDYIEQAMGGA